MKRTDNKKVELTETCEI